MCLGSKQCSRDMQLIEWTCCSNSHRFSELLRFLLLHLVNLSMAHSSGMWCAGMLNNLSSVMQSPARY